MSRQIFGVRSTDGILAIGSTLSRDLRTRFGDVKNVLDFGATPGDDSKDDTPAFNAAIAAGNHVFVPAGLYSIGGLITLNGTTVNGKHLELAGGAHLRKLTAQTANTDPLVHILGRNAKLSGGQITTENAHATGIIKVGHESTTVGPSDVLYCRVEGVDLFGVQTSGNFGIYMPSAQPVTAKANFFNKIIDVNIKGFDLGVVCTNDSNAHTFVGVHFWLGITAAWALDNAVENQIFGGFLHTSTDGIIGIRLKNACLYNSFHGFTIEPGGAASKGHDISSASTHNNLIYQNNAAGANVDGNYNNIIMSSGGFAQLNNITCQATFVGTDATPITVDTGGWNVVGGTIAKPSTGNYTLTYDNAVDGSTSAAHITTSLAGGGVAIVSSTSSPIQFRTYNSSDALADPAVVAVTVFGRY